MLIALLYALSIAVMLVYGSYALWMALGQARHQHIRLGPVPPPHTPPPPVEPWPHVLVQLPLYNEAAVAERLIDTCAAFDYPPDRLHIQVLDDSTDETTGLVAARCRHWQARGLDVQHLRRDHREGFKAGALQYGLARHEAPFVAIFDADFLPPPDFFRQTIPLFDAPEVGIVQTRWGHLNADDSLLTRLQALSLDAHFAVEQFARTRMGLFATFNGTAGVWRRACIDDAGGWAGDTLAEDLDLSFRAQMRGWRVRFEPDLEVPAELPTTLAALRAQQFRWTKGAAETARKLLRLLWQTPDLPTRLRVAGTFHLTASGVYPFILLAALLHAPLLLARHPDFLDTWGLPLPAYDPGEAYFGLLALGLVGFVGVVLAQLLAQRTLYANWPTRLWHIPLVLAGTMGLAVSNTRALGLALLGRRSPFVRTPKVGTTAAVASGDGALPLRPSYRLQAERVVPFVEGLFFVYSTLALFLLAGAGEWAAVPFQALFALGFGLITWFTLRPPTPAPMEMQLHVEAPQNIAVP
ncbi:MAG: glycosyltransferase [Bacteroidota bacterium]